MVTSKRNPHPSPGHTITVYISEVSDSKALKMPWDFLLNPTLGIQSPGQMMIGVYNHLLSKVFRFHYHSQKVIGSLGQDIKRSIRTCIHHHRNPRFMTTAYIRKDGENLCCYVTVFERVCCLKSWFCQIPSFDYCECGIESERRHQKKAVLPCRYKVRWVGGTLSPI